MRSAATGALAFALAACHAAPPSSIRPTQTFTGPGWAIAVPVDLGLTPHGPAHDARGGTWGSLNDGRPVLSMLVVRDARVPLEEYVRQLAAHDGSRILRQEPVAMPAGRAVYVELSNDLVPATHLVLVEPRAGIVATVSGHGMAGADLVEIARSLRVDDA